VFEFHKPFRAHQDTTVCTTNAALNVAATGGAGRDLGRRPQKDAVGASLRGLNKTAAPPQELWHRQSAALTDPTPSVSDRCTTRFEALRQHPWDGHGSWSMLVLVDVIVSLHVATGAAAGAVSGSRLAAVVLGPILHLAGDRLPHRDIDSRRFEIGSGLVCLAILARRRGLLDPATLGAAASSAPDLEHVVPLLRPRGSKLFHGRRGWHRSGPLPTGVQLLMAGVIIGALVAPRR